MKKHAYAFLAFIALLPALAAIMQGCKKVDAKADYFEQQPYLIEEGHLENVFNIGRYKYATRYIVGDTATLVGRFFVDDPATYFQIGNVKPALTGHKKVFQRRNNQRTGLPDSMDVVQFVITKEMGLGTNIPLSVHAKGRDVFGPSLEILVLAVSDKRTDSNLVVEKLGSWLPANVDEYSQNNIPLTHSSSVTDDGVLWFDNPWGIYTFNQQQAVQVIRKDESLKDQDQSAFTIDQIISSVISTDGRTLTFSAVVNEAKQADSVYITRLCQMDVASHGIKTLNRTEMYKGVATWNEPLGPFDGPAKDLKVAAVSLRTDITGNIWFVNCYMPYYTNRDFNSEYGFYYDVAAGHDPSSGGISTICRISPDGMMRSPLRFFSKYGTAVTPHEIALPVLTDAGSNSFILGRDGKNIYGLWVPPVGDFNDIVQYSLEDNDFVKKVSQKNDAFTFMSYDKDPVTKKPTTTDFLLKSDYYPNPNPYLALPNNDLLVVANSIYAYDLQQMTAYCYAGTENENLDVQKQETGKAKFINFTPLINMVHSPASLIGADKNGTVYIHRDGFNVEPYKINYTNGVQFYRLISKKQ